MASDFALSQNQLLEIANQTRQLCVNWRSYETSQMISAEDFNFINELDSAQDKQVILDKHGKVRIVSFKNSIVSVEYN